MGPPPRPHPPHADQSNVPRKASAADPQGYHRTIARGGGSAWRRARRILGFGPRWGLYHRQPRLGRDQRARHPTLGRDPAHLLHPQPTAPDFELHDAVAANKTADHLRLGAGLGTQGGAGALDHVDLPGSGKNPPGGPGNQHQSQRRRRKPLGNRKTKSRHRRPNAPFGSSISVGPLIKHRRGGRRQWRSRARNRHRMRADRDAASRARRVCRFPWQAAAIMLLHPTNRNSRIPSWANGWKPTAASFFQRFAIISGI